MEMSDAKEGNGKGGREAASLNEVATCVVFGKTQGRPTRAQL